MKRALSFIICVLLFSWVPAVATSTWQSVEDMVGVDMPAEAPSIRVLLLENADRAQVEVTGGYRLYNPLTRTRLSFGFAGKSASIIPTEKGLSWRLLFPGKYRLTIIPDNPESLVIVNGMEYKGRINIYQVDGKVNIVNEVPVENYLKSAMASRVNVKLPRELLSALAIIERTNAYYHMSLGGDALWDVKASEVGYNGVANTYIDPVIDDVVNKTHGLVMVYEDNGQKGPFAATWTEHSAGKTAPYYTIFRREAFAPKEPVEVKLAMVDRSLTAWSVPISKDKLASLADLDTVTDVALFVDKPSSKVYGMRIFNGEEYADIDFITLQEQLGKDQLKSSDFTVKLVEDQVVFFGYGRGHGVGLCLYTAEKMANQGLMADVVLKKFFPQVEIAVVEENPIVGEAVE